MKNRYKNDMQPNFITVSPVLKKFEAHGLAGRVAELSDPLRILRLNYDATVGGQHDKENTKEKKTQVSVFNFLKRGNGRPEMPAAFRASPDEAKPKTPMNKFHLQRVAMLVILALDPRLKVKLGLTVNDMHDLESCFDPELGGADRYRTDFDRLKRAEATRANAPAESSTP